MAKLNPAFQELSDAHNRAKDTLDFMQDVRTDPRVEAIRDRWVYGGAWYD